MNELINLHGYKRRVEALQKAPDVIPDMIKRALSQGTDTNYVLMDTWLPNSHHQIYCGSRD